MRRRLDRHYNFVRLIDFAGANRILTSLTTSENSKYTPSGTTNSNAGPSNYQNNRSGLGPPPGRNLAGQFNNLGSKEIRITSSFGSFCSN